MEHSTRRHVGLLNAAHLRGIWRWYVALFTALSFCLAVATAESHLHKDAGAAHDCAICCVVLDKLADAPTLPVLVHAVTMLSYCLVAFCVLGVAHTPLRLLPPSCGPPHASA